MEGANISAKRVSSSDMFDASWLLRAVPEAQRALPPRPALLASRWSQSRAVTLRIHTAHVRMAQSLTVVFRLIDDVCTSQMSTAAHEDEATLDGI